MVIVYILRLFFDPGWSAVSSTLTKEFGFVASCSGDWALDLCTYPMSIMVSQLKTKRLTYLLVR